jgi:hypothetical protein
MKTIYISPETDWHAVKDQSEAVRMRQIVLWRCGGKAFPERIRL